jgi:ribosomal protein S3
MGQKVNPVGLRLGVYRKWKSNWFVDSLNYSDFLHLNFEINKYFAGVLRNNAIKTFFSHCIIAKYSLEKIYIFVFFYRLRKRKKKVQKSFNTKRKNLQPLINEASPKNFNYIKYYKLLKLINLYNTIEIKQKEVNLLNFYKFDSKNTKKEQIPIDNNYTITRGNYTSLKTMENSLSEFLGTNVQLTFINLLSFIKFYLKLNKNDKFLSTLETQMLNFYRYDIKLLKDAINITYSSLLFKQPQTLANFIAYQLRRTPKNRRQSKLVQFYKKIISLMINQLSEIIGLRIKFKGRVNGRRRTISNVINIGPLPLQQHNCYIEYGQADALTIYGTIGIKVWIYYKRDFNNELQKNLLQYFYYTKLKK